MKIFLILVVTGIVILILVFLESFRELNQVKLTTYDIDAGEKFKGKKILFFSDFHEAQNGKLNQRIVKLVKEFDPEYILLGGDMVNSRHETEDFYPAIDLISSLAENYKIFYAYGNHEKRGAEHVHDIGKAWDNYLEKLPDNITFLLNDSVSLWDGLRVYGLDIPLRFYGRRNFPELTCEEIEKMLGKCNPEEYSILLGHTPDFLNGYSDWGADLVLAGHFHGGIVRFPFTNRGLVSPRLTPFADKVYGKISRGNTIMLITNGVGQHSIKLKLNNIPEVVGINFI